MAFNYISFTSTINGAGPNGTLCYDGVNTLYGTCYGGGTNTFGTIYSVNLSLNSIKILHIFNGTDGGSPGGGLILIDNVLYGTCNQGISPAANGCIFSINTDGTGFKNFLNFGTLIGYPLGNLLLGSDNKLYGTTQQGNGGIYSIDKSLTTYSVVLSSHPIPSPYGVIEYNGKLYGACVTGGTNGTGSIYTVDKSGNNFQILYNFQAFASGFTNTFGGYPTNTSLLNVGNVFYLSTRIGGTNANGTIISINPDGSNLKLLHTFSAINGSGINIDGANPKTAFFSLNGTLYGTCTAGGYFSYGTIFSINLDGTNFTTLFSFNNSNGNSPNTPTLVSTQFSSTIINNTLYGPASLGGANSNSGTVFSLGLPSTIIPAPISNICFPEKTPVQTDQGIIAIEKLNQDYHTINGESIVAITKTITQDKYLVCFERNSLELNCPKKRTIMTRNHKIYYDGAMYEAHKFLTGFEGVKKIKYNGEILYNIVLETYSNVNINNLICETLHPENEIAKLYTENFDEEYKNKLIIRMNDSIEKKDFYTYKLLTANLGTKPYSSFTHLKNFAKRIRKDNS